ncbi:hypothetical protein SAM23877_6013 [Streptomyces ambofaciens ATCC 23877]|uniref:Uncharacterized protein n=1 Tax=Streptomyces ambofaciens (strain ATCC 23877 / 3486 / DSM 40053 / JCM 4204 / NBRC 12836 / NRRL B-2516) TaxID=278992 RepID=A0A0K2B1I6_STRA7|nr:hypothetical protein SAM23877_6013 [Streptomyces ambofaciens ATCC 23877]
MHLTGPGRGVPESRTVQGWSRPDPPWRVQRGFGLAPGTHGPGQAACHQSNGAPTSA